VPPVIIDAYAHCGRTRHLPFEALDAQARAAGIDACLLVQHMGEFDNSYLASIVRGGEGRYGAIGLVDTRKPDAARHLETLLTGEADEAAGVRFLGARMTAEMIAESLPCIEVLNKHRSTLIAHLPTGIGVHLELLEQLARDFPGLLLYIPHMGWPTGDAQPTPQWHAAVRALRSHPRIVFGLSGMYHFSAEPFPHRDVWPRVRELVATVGADRMIWASDFPLLLQTESLADSVKLFAEGSLIPDANEREAILGGTAFRCWGLGPSS